LCSSVGADEKSWFLYPRTKGQVERDLKAKKLPLLSIFRPGLLENRHEARFAEKLGSFLPFFPKIEAKDAAKAMMKTA
jgi:oxidoreductase